MSLMNKLVLSCLKATELIERKFHVKLKLRQRLQLKIHLMICDACANYQKQSEFLDKGISQHLKEASTSVDIELLKKTIQEKILAEQK